jgi:hypothetical protein
MDFGRVPEYCETNGVYVHQQKVSSPSDCAHGETPRLCQAVCMYLGMYVCMYVYFCMYVCMYVCMYGWMRLCSRRTTTSLSSCMHVFRYLGTYVCICVCMHVCIYGPDFICVEQLRLCQAVCVCVCIYAMDKIVL